MEEDLDIDFEGEIYEEEDDEEGEDEDVEEDAAAADDFAARYEERFEAILCGFIFFRQVILFPPSFFLEKQHTK